MRGYISTLSIILVSALLLAACSKDPNAEANRLFVEAQQLIAKAHTQERSTEKLATLRDADQHLKSIMTQYPSANLAVQLSSGQSIGTISMQSVADEIAQAEQAGCFATPTRKCLFEEALKVGRSVKDRSWMLQWSAGGQQFFRVTFLGVVALAQARAGLKNESAATFVEAREAMENATGPSKNFGLSSLATSLAGAGRASDALSLIQGISDTTNRGYVLLAIARAQATSGLRDDAAASLREAMKWQPAANDDWSKIIWQLNVADVQILVGMRKEASDLVARAARDADALTVANGAPNVSVLGGWGNLADLEVKVDQSAAARDILSKALNAAQMGLRDANINILFSGRPILAAFADVTQITDTMSDQNIKSRLLYYAVQGFADTGRIPEAQQLSYSIQVPYFHIWALTALAQAQANAKLTSQASRTIASAIQLVRSIDNDGLRAYALLFVGQAVPQ